MPILKVCNSQLKCADKWFSHIVKERKKKSSMAGKKE